MLGPNIGLTPPAARQPASPKLQRGEPARQGEAGKVSHYSFVLANRGRLLLRLLQYFDYCFIIDNAVQTVSITRKWQVHIPVAIRKKLSLEKPTKASIYVEDKKIVLKPRKSKIFELEGSLKGIKPIKPINIDRVRDYIDYSKL